MKAEYIPPREDVIMQNEAPDDVYIIVSGEVEIIDYEMEKEIAVGTLQTGDMFGEVGALCCRPQIFTYRTKTLSQLLRLKTSALIEAMQSKQEDNVSILKNFLQVSIIIDSSASERIYKFLANFCYVIGHCFLANLRMKICVLHCMQHHKKLKDLNIGDLIAESGEEDGDPNMSVNLLTVASTGNAAFLDELLKARLDPDIGDSKGRTPLVCFHIFQFMKICHHTLNLRLIYIKSLVYIIY